MESAVKPAQTGSLRMLAGVASLCAIALTVSGAFAQESYPSKPIRMVFPYAAGGEADAFARAIADELRDRLGQPVLVESRPGANTAIAAEIVARAPSDGYTLVYLAWSTITTNLVMYKNIPYKLEDFQPITTFYRAPLGIAVRKDFPASTLKELIEFARKRGAVEYGTSGAGSSGNLMLARLSKATGVKFEHVPYKGDAPVVQDVMGGHIPMFAGALNTAAQHIGAGNLKVIATSSGERLRAYPDIPTFRDSGFEDQVFTYWHGMAAPAGTPRSIVDRLNAAVVAASESKRVRGVMTGFQTVSTMSPEAFSELIRRDIATWGPVIREMNMIQ
jgi:tripartite-type tricarboxylate transporter receptor subunit TctC